MKKTKSIINNYFFLLNTFFKQDKVFFVFVTISCFLNPINTLVDIYLLQFVIDSITYNKSISYILIGLLIFLGIKFLVCLFCELIEVNIGEKRMKIVRGKLSKSIIKKVTMTDTSHFDDRDFYDNYSFTVDQFVNQSHRAARLFWSTFSSIITIVTLLSIITVINPIIILISIINVFINVALSRKNSKMYFEMDEKSIFVNRRQSYINRLFYLKEYIFPIKTNNSSNILLKHFDNNVNDLVNIANDYRNKLALNGILISSNGLLFVGIILLLLSNGVIAGYYTVGTLASLFYASNNFKNNLQSFVNEIPNFAQISMYGKKIKSFFDTKSNIESMPHEESHELCKPYDIKLNNISFSYDGRQIVINKINYHIPAGKKIAIVGENGVGKTTLTKLLLRLYDVNEGKILINDTDIKEINLDDYRINVGTAFQENVDFALTIRENMSFYADVSDDAISKIFEITRFNKVIDKNNISYNTQLTKEFDKSGLELSGGQKQLLSICRLFTKKYGLIILDEPAASLDPLVEYELNKLILTSFKDTTIILISHRLSSVKDFDEILYIENGRIVENGNHVSLMNYKGKYYEMFTKQAEKYIK
ncbi:MAG: ABC transporter ATP-binding protein/permease [Erysipelotrichaceae bacterium]|nr:ABC transporter ATP-binding protein/permease [Erysipelotrichaceae bacterium]